MKKENLDQFIDKIKNTLADPNTISVEQIPLSARVKNCLRSHNIIFMAQLFSLNSSEMKEWRNMGKGSIEELEYFKNEFNKKYFDGNIIPMQFFSEEQTIKAEKDYLLRPFMNYVFPETLCVEKSKVFFKVKEGFLSEDFDSKYMVLPNKIHALMENSGMEHATDLLALPSQQLLCLSGLGAKSIDKIVSWYRNNTVLLTGTQQIDDFTLGMDNIKRICNASDDSFLMSAYRFNIVCLIQDGKLYFNRNKTIKAHILKTLQNKRNVIDCLAQDIINFLDGRDWTALADIESAFFKYGFDIYKIESTVDQLVDSKKIERLYRKYRIKYPSVKNWARNLPDKKQRDMVISRLKGFTLEELGIKHKLTRERVRQITKKAFSKAPKFSEDYDSYWYMNYNFSMETMTLIIGVSEEAYRYYSMIYDKGKKSIDLIPDDPCCTRKIVKAYYKYIYRNSICIEGEWVPCNRIDILRKAAELSANRNAADKEDIRTLYYQILSEYNLGAELNYASDVSLYNALDRSSYILKGCNGLRYYQMMNYELNDLVNSLHLEQFKNVIISSLKLFRDNPELMSEFELRDHYELHNLLKKYNDCVDNIEDRYDLRIGRMPNLYFGNCNLDIQLFDLLKKNSPIEGFEFACLVEEEYGLNHNSIIFNNLGVFKKYLLNGKYSISMKPLSSEEISFFEENLSEDFYFLADIEEKYIQLFPQEDFNRLNSYIWKKLGYLPYAHFVVKNSYASGSDYFTSVLTKNNMIDIDTLDSRIVNLQQFSAVLSDLTRNLELIEYDFHRYMRTDRFLEVSGVRDKKVISDFIKQFKRATRKELFFTDFYMRKKGFEHALYKSDSKNELIYALLIKNSRTVPYIRLGNTYLFSNTKEDFSMVSFIKWLIKDTKQVRMYNLISDIEMQYGISIKKDKIICKVKDSSMYYDSDMEKLYLTKNDFYNDL